MRVVPSVSKSQMFLWQHHLNMCVRLHMDSCVYIYIYIQTRDIDMQHYIIYTTESLYMHTYHISIYPVHINVTIDSLLYLHHFICMSRIAKGSPTSKAL